MTDANYSPPPKRPAPVTQPQAVPRLPQPRQDADAARNAGRVRSPAFFAFAVGSGFCYFLAAIAFVIGGLLFALAFTAENAPAGAQAAGMACFCGIVARIFQAEAHRVGAASGVGR